MHRSNTGTSYGWITKTFHWSIALMVLTMFALGWVASQLGGMIEGGASEDALLWWTKLLFTIHKTLGVTIFFLALARIAWAISQPKPRLLNGDNWLESHLAETMHWLLYGSLVLVPLSGWVYHASTSGFAPIWWPFGQSLPFVPKDPAVAEITGALHFILQWVLAGAIALHIAGALKHHLIDRDATLRRMLPGHLEAQPTARQPGHALPVLAALLIWGAALGLGAGLGWLDPGDARAEAGALDQGQGEWRVEDGTLSIAIVQNGSEVTGTFSDWTADITYSETPDDNGRHGAVSVTIAIASLSLGSVTDQAMGGEYFAAEQYPTAVMKADLMDGDSGLVADGTLRIREREVPVTMPVTLSIEDGTADASGMLTVDRRDFEIGMGTTDESSLAYPVEIDWQLTARRAE